MEIVLGEKYRDTVSGWEGIATARYEYMNGCIRIEISGADKDGKPEGFVFDVHQVERVEGRVPTTPAPTGGARSNRPVER